MSVTEVTLVKVKTLSTKMVKQILHVPFDMKMGSLYRRVHQGLTDDSIVPIGWCHPNVFDSNYTPGYWLVYVDNRYYWAMAPDNGPLKEKYATLEQLFV